MDFYELENGEKIYPLFSVEQEGKNYLFYSKKKENMTQDDIYVGEELNDDLLPVSDEMLPMLEKKYCELIKNLSIENNN